MTDVRGLERAGLEPTQYGSANSKAPHSRSFRAATAILLLPQFQSEQNQVYLDRKAPSTRSIHHRRDFCHLEQDPHKCSSPTQVVSLLDIVSGLRDDRLFSLFFRQPEKPITWGIHSNSEEEYTEPASSLTPFTERIPKVLFFVGPHFQHDSSNVPP